MPSPAQPLSREHWIETREKLARALKGEAVIPDEIPAGQPDYRCRTCQDTAVVVEKRLDKTLTSRRCRECKPRVDAEIKANNKYNAYAEDIPDEPAPKPRDFKQAAGLDGDE